MNTPEEIAQWIIDNRYSRNQKCKVSDPEMYNFIVDEIVKLLHPVQIADPEQIFTDYKEEK
jgi:hypothetical protein